MQRCSVDRRTTVLINSQLTATHRLSHIHPGSSVPSLQHYQSDAVDSTNKWSHTWISFCRCPRSGWNVVLLRFILLILELLPSGVLFRQPCTRSRHLHVRQEAPPSEVGSQQYAGTTHQRPSMEVRNLSSAFFFSQLCSCGSNPSDYLCQDIISCWAEGLTCCITMQDINLINDCIQTHCVVVAEVYVTLILQLSKCLISSLRFNSCDASPQQSVTY